MNKNVIYGALGLSVLVNIILCIIILRPSSDASNKSNKNDVEIKKQLEEKAKMKIKDYVCSNLYIPDSYDPVEIRVDSAFHYYMTDFACVKAGEDLIKDRQDYEGSKRGYDEAVNNIRTFGGSGVFRHYSVERDDCLKNMKEKKESIEKNEMIIKNRDASHDGEFIGWFVYNRYRAKNNNNTVTFNESLVLFDKDLEHWQISYNIDKNRNDNFEKVRKVIEDLLGNN